MPDPDEPDRLAAAIKELKLKYIVLTSVDRDDLPDFGATHFANCIKAIKEGNPRMLVEALVPDFQNNKNAIEIMVNSGADVLGHNVETVERLTPKVRDCRASYQQSLDVLRAFKIQHAKLKTGNPKLKTMCPKKTGTSSRLNSHSIKTKSSIMLGLGETKEEVIQTMKDLLQSKVDILTLGQYLQPTKQQLPVERYVPPDEFKEYQKIGEDLGFQAVIAGPFVRSSYKAAELFLSKD
jgi:lipoic acid synthetase